MIELVKNFFKENKEKEDMLYQNLLLGGVSSHRTNTLDFERDTILTFDVNMKSKGVLSISEERIYHLLFIYMDILRKEGSTTSLEVLHLIESACILNFESFMLESSNQDSFEIQRKRLEKRYRELSPSLLKIFKVN